MNKRKINWAMGGVYLLCYFLVACGQVQLPNMEQLSELTTQATATPADGRCRISIGVITSLSGRQQGGGTELYQGYQLALAEVNDQGGIQGCVAEMVVKDDASVEANNPELVKELAAAGLPIILGSYSSGATLKAAAEAHNQQIPLIVPSASTDLITQMGYTWVFRINSPASAYVSQSLNYVDKTFNGTGYVPTIGVIYENVLFGESAAVELSKQVEQHGYSLVAYKKFNPGQETFIPLLEEVKTINPDIIYLVANSIDDAQQLMEESKEIGLVPQMFIANAGAFITTAFLELGPLAENVIVTSQWSSDVEWQMTTGWKMDSNKFQEKFGGMFEGVEISARNVQGYAAFYVAVKALEKALEDRPLDSTTLKDVRQAIRQELTRLNETNTLFGPIKFDNNGQNTHPVLLVQVQGGKFVTIYPLIYRQQEPVVPLPGWQAPAGTGTSAGPTPTSVPRAPKENP